jgi:hypothetical protein
MFRGKKASSLNSLREREREREREESIDTKKTSFLVGRM